MAFTVPVIAVRLVGIEESVARFTFVHAPEYLRDHQGNSRRVRVKTKIADTSTSLEQGTVQRAQLPADSPIGLDEYEIARLAWEEGKAESSILEARGEDKTPANYTKIRRALQKAVRHGLLELKPPRNTQLERALALKYPSLEGVHVAVDRAAACLAAARMVASEIEDFLYRSDRRTMVVANAGGRTVRDTITYLQRFVPAPPDVNDKDKELIFVSLNAAEAHDQFDQCANFLTVRLAQIYDAPITKHYAVVKNLPPGARDSYMKTLQQIDLLISSAGDNTSGFLRDWLRDRGREWPVSAVGDVAFHVLDRRAKRAGLDEKTNQLLDGELARAPDWEDLIQLFNKKKVLLILSGHKREIAGALLESALARRCVFDARLAMDLVGTVG
jgi:hypothetical protein